MRLIVGAVALCMASWAASLSSQPGQPAERSGAENVGPNRNPEAKPRDDQSNPGQRPTTGESENGVKAQPQPTAEEETRRQAKENIEIQRKVARFTGWLIAATVAGPIILLAAVLWQAWIARDTEKRQLRAYVGISGREIFYSTGPNPYCYLILHNSGQTPAQRVECRMACRIGRHPMTDFPHEPEPFPVPGVLWPDAPVELEVWTREIAGDSRSGGNMDYSDKSAMYIYGDIRYRDAFRKQRVSNFRIMFRRPPNMGAQGKPLEFAPDGNFAT